MRISNEWLEQFVDLPPDSELENLFEMAGLGVEEHHDGVWTLEITSNRGDCLCAVGLAREVAAMSQARLHGLPHAPQVLGAGHDERLQVLAGVHISIEDGGDCAIYMARVVEGIKVGPSPDWMQARLIACGMRPINNVVDVTNYVMLELGQPLHAFDKSSLLADDDGISIRVRRARESEPLGTLDEKEHLLSPQVLVVSDGRGSRAIAAAGVMGGRATEVSDGTSAVLLESALFAPSVVRRGKRLLDLPSEASRRFERGVDAAGTQRALDRAALLLAEVAGGQVLAGVAQAVARPFVPRALSMRVARCNKVLGLALNADDMARALARLGFDSARAGVEARPEARAEAREEINVRVPSWRRDIEREIDLIEEVARVHGYNRIPTTLPRTASAASGRALPQRLQERARETLVRSGLSEVVTYSLESVDAWARAGLAPRASVRLRNPLSEDHAVLRTSILPSMLGVLERNARTSVAMFELAKVYIPRDADRPEAEQPDEKLVIGLAMLSSRARASWQKKDGGADFYTLKAAVENLLRGMNCPRGEFRALSEPGFHPGRCAVVSVDGQEIGVLGEVHPDVAARWGLDAGGARAFVAQIEFESLVRHAEIAPRVSEIARFPASERDVALVLGADVPASRVQSVLREAVGELLEAVEVFDVYTGPPIEPGQKSLALSLRFRAPDRTLLEEEIERAVERARGAAREALGASVRE